MSFNIQNTVPNQYMGSFPSRQPGQYTSPSHVVSCTRRDIQSQPPVATLYGQPAHQPPAGPYFDNPSAGSNLTDEAGGRFAHPHAQLRPNSRQSVYEHASSHSSRPDYNTRERYPRDPSSNGQMPSRYHPYQSHAPEETLLQPCPATNTIVRSASRGNTGRQ